MASAYYYTHHTVLEPSCCPRHKKGCPNINVKQPRNPADNNAFLHSNFFGKDYSIFLKQNAAAPPMPRLFAKRQFATNALFNVPINGLERTGLDPLHRQPCITLNTLCQLCAHLPLTPCARITLGIHISLVLSRDLMVRNAPPTPQKNRGSPVKPGDTLISNLLLQGLPTPIKSNSKQ